jgi:hypothetical protein
VNIYLTHCEGGKRNIASLREGKRLEKMRTDGGHGYLWTTRSIVGLQKKTQREQSFQRYHQDLTGVILSWGIIFHFCFSTCHDVQSSCVTEVRVATKCSAKFFPFVNQWFIIQSHRHEKVGAILTCSISQDTWNNNKGTRHACTVRHPLCMMYIGYAYVMYACRNEKNPSVVDIFSSVNRVESWFSRVKTER